MDLILEKIIIRNFLRISEFSVKSPGNINLIIGENDTGKTGLLRLLYAAAKSLELASRNRRSGSDTSLLKSIFSQKLDTVFQPRTTTGIGGLVTKGSKEGLTLDLTFASDQDKKSLIHATFTESARTTVGTINDVELANESFNALFIPAKEVLTAFRAIRFTRTPHDLIGFDDTYLDLIDALDIPTRSGNLSPGLVQVNKALEDLFKGEIKQVDQQERFIFKKNRQEFSMSNTAEGIKKIGILTTLIRNRQLNKHTILFLDEPETALHPKAIRLFMEMLVSLTQAGVQIFMSSHSYFVTKQLEIYARQHPTLRMQCCSLLNVPNTDSVLPVFSDLRDGLPENPIVDTALDMFDDEVALSLA